MARNPNYLPIGKDPQYRGYHEAYDNFRMQSTLLNMGENNLLFGRINIADEKGIKTQLVYTNLQLEKAEENLKEVQFKFEDLQQEAINKGFRPPEKMPESLMEVFLIKEAEKDVIAEEIKLLERLLSKFTKKRDEEREANVLKRGLEESTQGREFNGIGTLNKIDFQQVDILEGVPVITEPTSPYRGMKVVDYRDMARAWKKEMGRKFRGGMTVPREVLPALPKNVELVEIPSDWAIREI